MTNIKLIVNGAKARAEVDGILTSSSIGIPVAIQYDSTWDGLTKNLVCTSGKWGPTGKPRTILNIESSAAVAHEVMIADNHLYIGVEGRSADGALVICTVWADCGTIFPGVEANADPSVQPTLPIWAQLQKDILELKQNNLTDAQLTAAITRYFEQNGNCLTDEQIRSLDNLFKTCAYIKSDISSEYAAFLSAFGLTDSSGSKDEDESGETMTTYTVTNNLTGVTTNNAATTVSAGSSYAANLTVVEGYTLESLVIAHNGKDITDTAYGDGYILITNVSGDIVITAVAAERQQIETVSTYADIVNLYSDAGSVSLGVKYYLNGVQSLNATETDTPVTLVLTNTTDTDVTFTGYIGCNTMNQLYFADSGKSITVPARKRISYAYIVQAGYKFVFAGIPIDGTITAALYGNFDVYQPIATYPVESRYFDTIKTYSDGTTDTILKTANYQRVVTTSETFAEEADLIITLVGGETDTTFTNTDWYFGSADPASLNTIYHGVRMGGANATVKAGQIIKYTYTVKAGYAFAISNVLTDLTANMVFVEKA